MITKIKPLIISIGTETLNVCLTGGKTHGEEVEGNTEESN